MNRGVLKLTNEEALEIVRNFDIEKYTHTPLYNKLTSINLEKKDIEILLSEDELEYMLDDIGFVDKNTNPKLFSAIEKINELIHSFSRPGTQEL